MNSIVSRTLGMLFIALMLLSCGGSIHYELAGTDRVPGADFVLDVDRQDGGNWLVTLEASNLPPPARLNDQMTLYSVWIVPDGQTPQRIGNLTYDEGDRAGTMSATTVTRSFQVVVSAEINAEAGAPSDVVVFRSSVEAP